jgi:hypothetical protein
MAWDNKQSLTPDAFVTGELRVAADLQTAKVVVYGFTRDNPADLKELYTTPDRPAAGQPAAVPTDRSLLAMVGATFSVVDRALDRTAGDKEAIQQALAGLTQPAAFAQRMALSPVRLDVVLNGRVVEPEADPAHPNAGRIAADPRQGDEVQFRLTNTSKAKTYGVLLAVNGRNTNALNHDHLNARPAKDQRLWVLGPGEEAVIQGFYTDVGGAFKPFRILGDTESEAAYALMGEQYRGLITMHVFGERSEAAAPPKAPAPAKAADDRTAEKPAEVAARTEATVLSLGVGGDALEDVRTAGSPEKARERIQSLTNTRPAGDGR